MRIVLAFLLLCGSALAELPKATITGPTSGKPGDLIVLDSKDSVGTHRTWRCWVDLAGPGEQKAEALERWATALRDAGWSVTSPASTGGDNWLEVDGGSKLILPSYPGTYRAALAVGSAEGVDLALWTVVVTGGTAPPAPPDEPPPSEPPPVTPDPPATTFGFTKAKIAEWIKLVPGGNQGQAPSLAEAFRVTGQDALNGKFSTIAKAEAAGNAAILAAIKAGHLDHAAWTPFGQNVQLAIDALKGTGKILTPKDYGRALLELSEAMK